jgi:hypothetical protein
MFALVVEVIYNERALAIRVSLPVLLRSISTEYIYRKENR